MAIRTASFTLSPAVKRKWLSALRSGKYKQGTTYLYNACNDTYCVLGVLGEIEGATKKEMNRQMLLSDIGMFMKLIPEYSKLTRAQKKKAKDYDKEFFTFSVMYNGAMTSLAEINDNGIPFSKIADIIEKQVKTH